MTPTPRYIGFVDPPVFTTYDSDGRITRYYELPTHDESPHLDATPRFPAETVGSLNDEEKE